MLCSRKRGVQSGDVHPTPWKTSEPCAEEKRKRETTTDLPFAIGSQRSCSLTSSSL